MTALTGETVRTPRPRQSRADAQKVYDEVTERDKYCRAWRIDPDCDPVDCIDWVRVIGEPLPLERHHAGNTIGSKRITDARHVVLLCQYHHRTWAPTHSRLILEYLRKIEDQREAL